MATSSRQSSLFGVQDWKKIYQTFSQANFQSYDYETLRKSFVDYLRLYYPETFNDFTESSEFVALLDIIAFMGQGLSFRNDLNTRENFIDTAERRDSVVKLANLVSYTPKRNIAANGYVKVVSIKTTENITDLNGFNLSNAIILWNDPANSNWLNQFNTIVNAALIDAQRIGRPGNSQIVLGVKTDEYSMAIPNTALPIVPFSSVVDGISMPFEIVSATSVDSEDIYEIPPSPSGRLNVLYRNDKLGYGSPNTGFFFYFKQGQLQNYDFTLLQQISSQQVNIGDIEGVNNSDTWLYQIDSTTNTRTLWTQVDSVYANVSQNSELAANRQVYSVQSRFNDQVSYSFGDGVFSQIPIGNFRAYIRVSNGLTYTVDPSEMQGISVDISYISRVGKTETLTLGLQLTSPVNNAQARESISSIKQRAPSRYYTQNRMVNGEDYSNFPYTLYGSIIKSKALNRTSVGVSRNLDLVDPTQKYSSTNSFASDGALYQNTTDGQLSTTVTNVNTIITFLTGQLAVALASNPANQYYIQKYTRYTPTPNVYWKTATTDTNTVSGYFYIVSVTTQIPIAVGTYSTNNTKYITNGALVELTAPTGYYFDSDNRLTTSSAPPARTTAWAYISNVVGDGSNFGRGEFSNGTGPITLSGYFPSGVRVTDIIPVFSNTLSASVIQQCVERMEAGQNFTLLFNNSLLINQDRWSIGASTNPGYFVKFTSLGGSPLTYSVAYRSLKYMFGSVADTRFYFSGGTVTYDPRSGKVLQDFINILESNPQPNSVVALGQNIQANIIDQPVEADGYVNDYEVEISSYNINDRTVNVNPDFFKQVTGYDFSITPTPTNTKYFVFFQQITDTSGVTSYQILDTSTVVYQYATKAQIEVVKYDYPLGQLYYAYSEDKFYISEQNAAVQTPSYTLTQQTTGAYVMRTGRQGLYFQYCHISNNTTRIDPSTTNIIDLYIVTQSYYNSYINWVQDSTNTVTEPDRPTINDLNAQYGEQLNEYKMMSDAVVMNSVVFKPLFGPKAATQLQGKVKVVKSSSTTASDSEIRSAVVSAMNTYFSIVNWDFGSTFYFSELSAYLHSELSDLISSVVLVPANANAPFGTLYEIKSAPYEIFVNAATVNDVEVIAALTPSQLQIS